MQTSRVKTWTVSIVFLSALWVQHLSILCTYTVCLINIALQSQAMVRDEISFALELIISHILLLTATAPRRPYPRQLWRQWLYRHVISMTLRLGRRIDHADDATKLDHEIGWQYRLDNDNHSLDISTIRGNVSCALQFPPWNDSQWYWLAHITYAVSRQNHPGDLSITERTEETSKGPWQPIREHDASAKPFIAQRSTCLSLTVYNNYIRFTTNVHIRSHLESRPFIRSMNKVMIYEHTLKWTRNCRFIRNRLETRYMVCEWIDPLSRQCFIDRSQSSCYSTSLACAEKLSTLIL